MSDLSIGGGARPTGPREPEPTQTQGVMAKFGVAAKAPTNFPQWTNASLEAYLQDGVKEWSNKEKTLYYKTETTDVKLPHGKTGESAFYVTTLEYRGKPGKKSVPSKEFKNAFYVRVSKGKFATRYTVYEGGLPGKGGHEVTNLNYRKVTNIPNNLNKFRKEDPVMYKKFMHAWIMGLALQIMHQMRRHAKKMKEAMRQNLE